MYIYGSKVRVHVRIWYWLGIFFFLLWGRLYAPAGGTRRFSLADCIVQPRRVRGGRKEEGKNVIVQLAVVVNKLTLSRSVETNDERNGTQRSDLGSTEHVLMTEEANINKRGVINNFPANYLWLLIHLIIIFWEKLLIQTDIESKSIWENKQKNVNMFYIFPVVQYYIFW